MTAQQVTFVTVGKLKGKTINLGPNGKYRFVDGEMKVDEEVSGLVARSLRFYSAFPKGDAEPFHIAACEKLGIDPDTGKPVAEMAAEQKAAPKPEPVPDPEPELEVETELPDKLQRLREVLECLDKNDESLWTAGGKPTLAAVTAAFGEDVSRSEINAVWDVILNDT